MIKKKESAWVVNAISSTTMKVNYEYYEPSLIWFPMRCYFFFFFLSWYYFFSVSILYVVEHVTNCYTFWSIERVLLNICLGYFWCDLYIVYFCTVTIWGQWFESKDSEWQLDFPPQCWSFLHSTLVWAPFSKKKEDFRIELWGFLSCAIWIWLN